MKSHALASALVLLLVATTVSAGGVVKKPTTYNINWLIPPRIGPKVTKALTVCIGDTLKFTWLGTHGLTTMPTAKCPTVWPKKNILVPNSLKGSKVIKVATAGTVIYSCQFAKHCLMGQVLTVKAIKC